MQIQLWWYTETVPADDIQIFKCIKMITSMRMFQVYFDLTLLERFKTASVLKQIYRANKQMFLWQAVKSESLHRESETDHTADLFLRIC